MKKAGLWGFIGVWVVVSWPAWAEPPQIVSLAFPSYVASHGEGIGTIVYEDLDQDVIEIRFDVADGRYQHVVLPTLPMTTTRAQMAFTLPCWPYDQQITLAVRVLDAAGESSKPKRLTFTCGRPVVYDFDAQQAQVLPVETMLPLNVFLFDDGETTVAEGASFEAGRLLGIPRPEVVEALRSIVLPKLTGIWDQCGIGFELASAWVVRPEDLQLPGLSGSLADQLYTRDRSGKAILNDRKQAVDALQQAAYTLWEEARRRHPQAARALNVFVFGARILIRKGSEIKPIEGFAWPSWPSYAAVRWGAVLPGVVPKQMIATLAHELGHKLGLGHPDEDGLPDTWHDRNNLMKGSGTTPQPRVHLLPSQCRVARQTLVQLFARMDALTGTPPTVGDAPATSTARVRWLALCPGGVCTGVVRLEVQAEGFPDLQSFSFALFEFSQDGDHFVEIGVDRTASDGFWVEWDTRRLPEGTYILRVTVTDATGVRATMTARVEVRN
jgi:hypothetical protein